jgi:hypothetical protein
MQDLPNLFDGREVYPNAEWFLTATRVAIPGHIPSDIPSDQTASLSIAEQTSQGAHDLPGQVG